MPFLIVIVTGSRCRGHRIDRPLHGAVVAPPFARDDDVRGRQGAGAEVEKLQSIAPDRPQRHSSAVEKTPESMVTK